MYISHIHILVVFLDLCYNASTTKFTIRQALFFLWFFKLLPDLVFFSVWTICIWEFRRTSCVSFSKTDSGLCLYHLVIWSNFNFLHISQWITIPSQSCLLLYSLCARLLYSVTIRLIYSSLLPHIAVEYTDCFSEDPSKRLLFMTLNNLMVRFQ